MELVYGSCNAIPFTLPYSFETDSGGISISLEDASWARKTDKNAGNLYRAVPGLRECCRQVEAEEVSNQQAQLEQNSPSQGTAI